MSGYAVYKKLMFACLLLVCAVTAFGQTSACDSIVWKNNRKLTWADFKAQPDSATVVASQTHYDFNRTWDVQGNMLITAMICSFNPCLSWSKKKESINLLAHEQGHFDIAEYFRRLYNKRIASARYTPDNLPGILKNVFIEINRECAAMQNAYDTETLHSLKVDEQKAWTKNISALLKSVKKFNQQQLIVPLSRN